MPDAASVRLTRLQKDLSVALDKRMDVIVESERSSDALAEVLGQLRAARQLVRRIANQEISVRTHERRAALLQAKLREATSEDRGLLNQHLQDAKAQVEHLAETQRQLVGGLEALTSQLKDGSR